jgi:hypothetical protein
MDGSEECRKKINLNLFFLFLKARRSYLGVIRNVMANAAEPLVRLTVPLGIEIGTGPSWGAAH